MALWQFDLLLIPRGSGRPVLSEDGWIAPPVSESVTRDTIGWLEGRLGEPSRVMGDSAIYGSDKGNRVDVLTNDDGTGEIQIRMNASLEAEDFSDFACELAGIAGCDLFGLEKGAVLDPTPEALRQEIANSKAGAFVQNPRAYIRRVADEG
jgi:hypothetical protein